MQVYHIFMLHSYYFLIITTLNESYSWICNQNIPGLMSAILNLVLSYVGINNLTVSRSPPFKFKFYITKQYFRHRRGVLGGYNPPKNEWYSKLKLFRIPFEVYLSQKYDYLCLNLRQLGSAYFKCHQWLGFLETCSRTIPFMLPILICS